MQNPKHKTSKLSFKDVQEYVEDLEHRIKLEAENKKSQAKSHAWTNVDVTW